MVNKDTICIRGVSDEARRKFNAECAINSMKQGELFNSVFEGDEDGEKR